MLVKAKWNVKDAFGWHRAGDIWNTENDLGDAVEVLDAPKAVEPEKEHEPEIVNIETVKPKTTRRKVSK